jgi:hypothetical protein
MNEPIPHTGDLLPLDLWNLIAYFLGDLLCRFADDLDATHEGALLDFVSDEGCKRYLGGLRC